MSDARLRELERQAATGDEDARARLLLERERLGHFPRERLALAAHAGDPAARRALDLPAEDGLDLLAWARGFYAFGQHACVRVVAAAVGPVLAGQATTPTATAPLEALGPWLVCPCPEHAAPVVRLARAERGPASWPGLLLGVDWDQGPALTLRRHGTSEEAGRAGADLMAVGAVVDVAPLASGDFALRLRECFGASSEFALIQGMCVALDCDVREVIDALNSVDAVPFAISELSTALGAHGARDVVGRALIAWALDPASR